MDFDVLVPRDPRLEGATFHGQIVVLQAGANALGAFLSPGSTDTLGRHHGISRVSSGLPAAGSDLDLKSGLAIGLDGPRCTESRETA